MTLAPISFRELAEELEQQGAGDLVDELEESRSSKLTRNFPKPGVLDVTLLRDYLEELYRPLHEGEKRSQGEGAYSYTGLRGLRDLRYGRDKTPLKLQQRLQNDLRIRSMASHRLITNIAALLGRNQMQVTIPAASGQSRARQRAQKEQRWCRQLETYLEDGKLFPPIQESDDAQCEAFGGWEIYLTDAYDDIDFDRLEGETDKEWEQRVDTEKREAGMPFGIRAIDPMSTFIEPDESAPNGIGGVLIIEKKRRRPLRNRLAARYGEDKAQKILPPLPGDPGSSGGLGGTTGGEYGETETIRYYDPVWYGYMVDGKWVEEPTRHGLPGVPIIPAWGRVTSGRNFGDKFQGVAYHYAFTEPIANDIATQKADATLTYNRPKLVGVGDANAPESTSPTLNLAGPELLMLPPGFTPVDIYKDFRQQQTDPILQLIMGFGEQNALAPVAQGVPPSADASGFALNLMSSNALGPFSPFFKNKANAWARLINFVRIMIRDTIGESVYMPVSGQSEEGSELVEWLELGPDDITDIPSRVTLDPLSDQERMAISKWLESGVLNGVIPKRILAMKGYGIEDWQEAQDEIWLEQASGFYDQLRMQQVQAELVAEAQPAGSPIVGPDGQPLPPSQGDMQEVGAAPIDPRASTIGKVPGRGGGMGFAEGNAGARPPQQGLQHGDLGQVA